MGDKRLNFIRPLLSARRFSLKQKPALLPSPSYKSELQSGPLRNPGTVPFVWEQIPGIPKHESETKTQKPHVVPNLPPGRILKPKKQDSDIITQGIYVEKGPLKDNDNDDGNEDENDFDYAESGNMSYKFCGLLPQFCLRGSIGLVNQTTGLSARSGLPVSSANKTRVGSSSASSRDARVAAYEPKPSARQQKDLNVLNHESTEDTNPNNSQNCNESSPYFISETKDVNIQKKEGLVTFMELLAYEIKMEAALKNPAVEKTVYVDTVHKEF